MFVVARSEQKATLFLEAAFMPGRSASKGAAGHTATPGLCPEGWELSSHCHFLRGTVH